MILHVKVKPGSKVDSLFFDETGLLNIKLKAPAQDGKANEYLVQLLGKELKIAKSKITILSGFTNQFKKLEIDIPTTEIETFYKT